MQGLHKTNRQLEIKKRVSQYRMIVIKKEQKKRV